MGWDARPRRDRDEEHAGGRDLVQGVAAAGPARTGPIVLRTACGSFRLGRDGSVTRVPASPQRGRARAADLTVRRNRTGRFFVLRGRHVVWRSTGSYPNDGGQIAFGPHSFAFATYRGGVYLTDLEGPEHMVVRGRSMFPLGISSEGDLLVAGRSRIRVISPAGALVRSYGYRTRDGYAFDERTQTSSLTPKRLPGCTRAVLRAIRCARMDLVTRVALVLRPTASRGWKRSPRPATGAIRRRARHGRSVSFRLSTAHPERPEPGTYEGSRQPASSTAIASARSAARWHPA